MSSRLATFPISTFIRSRIISFNVGSVEKLRLFQSRLHGNEQHASAVLLEIQVPGIMALGTGICAWRVNTEDHKLTRNEQETES